MKTEAGTVPSGGASAYRELGTRLIKRVECRSMTPCRGSEDFVRLGGRFKLKYRSGDGSYVESFVSGLAAIERAAAV